MAAPVHVVAGVIRDESGRVLVTQRLAGTHMAGRWEFPGGKLHVNESRHTGLARELKEELGITVTECAPLIRLHHRYPDRDVMLDFWSVRCYDGQPSGIEGQALQWLHIDELQSADILEADKPVIDSLRLPDCYAITPAQTDNRPYSIDELVGQIDAAVCGGVGLIQLRAPGVDADGLHKLAVAAVQTARGAKIIINGDPVMTLPIVLAAGAAGLHVPTRFFPRLSSMPVPPGLLVGASCHSQDELSQAACCGAHFAVLGPVLPTASHPDLPGLGWDRFGEWVDRALLPVYALGGVGPEHIERAQALGGQGVAGIRAFFASGGSIIRDTPDYSS